MACIEYVVYLLGMGKGVLQHLLIRHTLDVMHVERNVINNVLKTILGDKDTAAVREDMRELRVRPWLWLQNKGDLPNGSMFKPHAPYVFSEEEKTKFMDCISNIKVPTCCSTALKKHVVKGKLQSLKSLDVYILCQQILPIVVRHLLHLAARAGIIRLCVVFQKLCAKVVNPGERL